MSVSPTAEEEADSFPKEEQSAVKTLRLTVAAGISCRGGEPQRSSKRLQYFAVNTTTRAASRPPRFMVVYSFPIVNLSRREENTEELGNVFQFRKIYHFISNRRHLSELACDVSHVTAHTSVGISFHNERAIKFSGTWEYDISYR